MTLFCKTGGFPMFCTVHPPADRVPFFLTLSFAKQNVETSAGSRRGCGSRGCIYIYIYRHIFWECLFKSSDEGHAFLCCPAESSGTVACAVQQLSWL